VNSVRCPARITARSKPHRPRAVQRVLFDSAYYGLSRAKKVSTQMSALLETFQENGLPKVSQVTGSPVAKTMAGIDQLLLVLPARIPAALWRKIPQGSKVQALMRRQVAGAQPAVMTRLANKRQTALIVGKVDTSLEAFEILSLARKLVSAATSEKAGTLGIWVLGFDDTDQKRLIADFLAAALAAAFVMPAYKSKATPSRIRSLRLIGLTNRLDLDRTYAEAEGNNLARFLTALPANKLDAVSYTGLIKEMAGKEGWQYKRYGVKELEKLGAGAFLAVAQGNDNDSAAIVRLRYRPGSQAMTPALSLVGKGIIFDTGGTNLKPFASMLDMHIDMGGSAVALGALLAATRLKLDTPIDCWLAITENRTGPNAYKSQDVVTALNGKTIQTIHTDAEGRMALADALALASQASPDVIIDYATLTGACMNAVTSRYSGVFTNRPNLHPVLRKSGRDSGERVWPFPIGKEFREELRSETADLKQCSPGGGGDHILAASFLEEFVDEKIAWIHIDLSACTRKGGLAHVPTDITGFGVRFSMNLIIDKDVVHSASSK
jgi:leucyl aminopeptidase